MFLDSIGASTWKLVAEGESFLPELSVKGEKYFLIIGRVNPEKDPRNDRKTIPVVEEAWL